MNDEYMTEHTQASVEAPQEVCMLCKVQQHVELVNHRYCQRCHQQLDQAYKWLQGPLVEKDELKELHDIMLDLTDISKLFLE
jgi:hypothetical protein